MCKSIGLSAIGLDMLVDAAGLDLLQDRSGKVVLPDNLQDDEEPYSLPNYCCYPRTLVWSVDRYYFFATGDGHPISPIACSDIYPAKLELAAAPF